MPWPGAQAHADDLVGARAPGGLVVEAAVRAPQRDRRRRGVEHAGGRLDDRGQHAGGRLADGGGDADVAAALGRQAAAEPVGERLHRGQPALRVDGQRGVDRREQLRARALRRPHAGVAGGHAGEQRPGGHGEPVDVRARRQRAARERLGRHVAGRPDALGRALGGEVARDPEVDEHDAALGREHQVLRLDVAVDRLLLVHVAQRLGRLQRELDDLVLGQPGRALAAQHVREVLAVHPLHHQVAAARVVDRPEHLDDARVVEARQQAALDLEAGRVALVEQPLGGHGAAVGPGRAVDAAHRALSRRFPEPITADELRTRPWSVHGADGTAFKLRKRARSVAPAPRDGAPSALSGPWRKLGGAVACASRGSTYPVGDPPLRTRRGQHAGRAGRSRAAGAPGPAAARLPRLSSHPRLPALRARGRAVARARAGGLGLRAQLAALQAPARARPGRADRPRRAPARAARAAVGRHGGARRRGRGHHAGARRPPLGRRGRAGPRRARRRHRAVPRRVRRPVGAGAPARDRGAAAARARGAGGGGAAARRPRARRGRARRPHGDRARAVPRVRAPPADGDPRGDRQPGRGAARLRRAAAAAARRARHRARRAR